MGYLWDLNFITRCSIVLCISEISIIKLRAYIFFAVFYIVSYLLSWYISSCYVTIECLFYCRIFEKTLLKKTLFLQYILQYIIHFNTHISVTEYIKERCLFITTIYFLITNKQNNGTLRAT